MEEENISENIDQKEEKKIELNEEDNKNINLIKNKYNLDDKTCLDIYIAFNKNIIAVLKYISNEIDEINIIHNQTNIDIEKAREIYYKFNKDIIKSISYILEDTKEEEKQNDIKEFKPVFDENKTYRHIIEDGRELLYDNDNNCLFDAETKDFFSEKKSIENKIQEARTIVDSKDKIIQSQKKNIKKEKLQEMILTYQQQLLDWGRKKLESWEEDEKLKEKYPTLEEYKIYLENEMKFKFAKEINCLS